jgi:5-methyltetrahydropteroyltriglutamate--homocysteine methyltransferase
VKNAIVWASLVLIEEWQFTQERTEKPVKGIITGPYALMDWSFDESYASREEATMTLAGLLHHEAQDVESAGAKIIQVDELVLSIRINELPLLLNAVVVVKGDLDAKTILHTCCGDYKDIYAHFNRLPVGRLDLEMSNSSPDLLDRFRGDPFRKEVAFGVIDVHSHVVKTKE